jgi:putative tryptophan/tyrosine transport system substrate-binding protein
MRRREFVAAVGATVVWPLTVHAQQTERMRRIGVLTPYSENDPVARAQFNAFVQGLAELGWSEGRNLRMDVRWAAGDLERVRMYAKELVMLQPDVILVDSTPQTAALQRETRTIPIVFVVVSDPVGSGFVAGLPRPGGNMTGFSNQDPTMGGKWVELLKEIAPNLSRVAAVYNPETAPFVRSYYLPPFEAAARSLKIEPIVALVHSDAEIETAITSLGRESGGVVIMPDAFLNSHRATIISLAARNKVPAVSQTSFITRDGGLISYGPDLADLYRRGAGYVDRILRGARPSDLPVQLPAKFEMAVNVKTAKTLGLTVPPSLLARADEVIE